MSTTVLTDDEAKEYVAANVVRLMNAKGLSQSDLARLCKVNFMAISRMARGTNLPPAWLLSRVAEVLKVSVDDLLADPAPGKKSGKIRRRA